MQPDKEEATTVESFETLIQTQVRERVYDPAKWEDCAQEARIALWRIMQRRPNMPRSYYAAVTRNRIRLVSQTGIMLGSEGVRGQPVDPLRQGYVPFELIYSDVSPPAPVEADHAKVAKVREAISTLPETQQQHVHERFYEHIKQSEMSGSYMLWLRPVYGARAKLHEALKDLAA